MMSKCAVNMIDEPHRACYTSNPVLFALFLQAMYGAVDLLIVGKFAASADVSAVSTGSQIMMTLTNLVSSFAMAVK